MQTTLNTHPADLGTAELGLGVCRLTRELRGGIRILDDVSMTIAPGTVVAIAGNSGAGKSTLLDAIAGLRPATSGSVTLDGVDLYANLDTFRSRFGYVPQDDIIHRDLPLADTLSYAAQLRLPTGTSRADVDAAVAQVLEELDLEAQANVRVGRLSGGQRKRASIAVELLTRPRYLFLDEPTSGLDPATSAALVRTLRALAERGCTVVFTTHNPDDIAKSDTVAFMAKGGRLLFHGSPMATLQHFGVDRLEDVYGCPSLRAVGDQPLSPLPEPVAGRTPRSR